MKFKIEEKDLIAFVGFCILLLYICAIGVLNLSTLAEEGHLYGLDVDPIEIFTI